MDSDLTCTEASRLDDAAELRRQIWFAVEVCKRIRSLRATPKEIAARLGITQSRVPELKRGKFDRFSSKRRIARLARSVVTWRCRVTPAPRRRAGRFAVKAAQVCFDPVSTIGRPQVR